MEFDILTNLKLFLTMRHISFGSTSLLQKKIKKQLHKEFVFFRAKASNVDKETALASDSDNILSKVDEQDTKKVIAQLSQDKTVLQEKLLDI